MLTFILLILSTILLIVFKNKCKVFRRCYKYTVGVLIVLTMMCIYFHSNFHIQKVHAFHDMQYNQIKSQYEESKESRDKHVRLSGHSAMLAWNEYVSNYKQYSKNVFLNVFYDRDVSDSLRYIYR